MLQMSQYYEPESKKKIVRLYLEEGRSLKGLVEENVNLLVKQIQC